MNGEVAASVSASDSGRIVLDRSVAVPAGGWIAARVIGPSSRYVADSYAFAQTSPVYIVRNGQPFTSAEDARFFVQTMDAILARVKDAPWRTTAEQAAFSAEVAKARAVYAAIASR